MMIRKSVRFASDSDSKDIFEWRNDELTCLMSHTSDIVEWKQHSKWYENSLASENCILIICHGNSGEKIAVVRFDVSESDSLISINLNSNQRGKGLAKVSLIKSIDFFSEHCPKAKRLVAEIKEENIASQKVFLGVGFKKYKTKDNVGFYEKNLV